MANGCDVDDVLVPLIKENPAVTTAKPEASERRLEVFHVAGAVGQVAIHAVENLHCGVAPKAQGMVSLLSRCALVPRERSERVSGTGSHNHPKRGGAC